MVLIGIGLYGEWKNGGWDGLGDKWETPSAFWALGVSRGRFIFCVCLCVVSDFAEEDCNGVIGSFCEANFAEGFAEFGDACDLGVDGVSLKLVCFGVCGHVSLR